MKTYELLFVHGVNAYVIISREDFLVSVIKRELKKGVLLSYIKEVKENE